MELEAYGWADLAGTALRSGPPNEMRMNEPNGGSTDATFDTVSSPHSHGPPGGRSLPDADLLARGGETAEAIEQELLTRLVALNHERAAEEKRGLIRWLRPDYQNCSGGLRPSQESSADPIDGRRPPLQSEIDLGEASSQSAIRNPQSTFPAWPSGLPEQVAAIHKLLPTLGPDAEALSAHFGRKNKKRSDQITIILATLKALGHIG